jgi:hypothetical protein
MREKNAFSSLFPLERPCALFEVMQLLGKLIEQGLAFVVLWLFISFANREMG